MTWTKYAVAVAFPIVVVCGTVPGAWSQALMSPEVILTNADTQGDNPGVAYNPISNQYLVVWREGSQGLRGRFVKSGWTLGDVFQITGAYQSDGSPRVAFDTSRMRYLVVWNRGGQGGRMYGRFIPWNGPTPNLAAFIICPSVPVFGAEDYSVAYSTTQDEFLVVWATMNTTPATYFPTVGRRVRGGGGFPGSTFFIADHPPDNRSHAGVAYNPARNEYLVSTHDYPRVNDNIYGVRVTGAGAVQTESTIAGWPDEEAMATVAASLTGDQYLVVWDSIRIGDGRGIYARFVSGAGTLGSVKEIVRWSHYYNYHPFPDVAWGVTDWLYEDPRYLVVYRDSDFRLLAREVYLNETMGDSFEISVFSEDRHAVAGGRTHHLVTWASSNIIRARFVGNTTPQACFSTIPADGYSNKEFQFDASCSTDATQQTSQLQVRWDWNGDDIYEAPWSYTKTILHRFELPPSQSMSVFNVRMQVTDGMGEVDTVTHGVIVRRPIRYAPHILPLLLAD